MSQAPESVRPRDRLLDLLRAISIVRVVGIHILRQGVFWFWPAPTFVAPGMPVVFFVSGSLAHRSLRVRDGVRRRATTYWRRTYRRLLLPYWAFYAVVAVVAVVGDRIHDGDGWRIRWTGLAFGATGLAVPRPSPEVAAYIGHLWFMSVFLVLAFLAPLLVRCFDRSRAGLIGGVLAVFVVVQWIEMGLGVRVPYEIDALSMFSVMYVIGFLYTDGTLRTWSGRTFAVLAGALAVATWCYDAFEPGAANRSEPKHLLVGLAWLAAGLAVAPALSRFGDRHRELLDRITRRTFTAYLWGWPTTRLAAQWSPEWFGRGWDYRISMAVLALALLGVAVWIFGWFEDYSARRPPPPETPVGRPGPVLTGSVD